MCYGENVKVIIDVIKMKFEVLKVGLLEGVNIVFVYDCFMFIDKLVEMFLNKLMEELLVVGVVCVFFLFYLCLFVVVLISLFIGIFVVFIVMKLQGFNVNIMLLGGIVIVIGVMVDGVIVVVENLYKYIY